VGLEVIEGIDAQREDLAAIVADIEARLSEFSASPTSDAVLDYYVSIRTPSPAASRRPPHPAR
jgi:hypothetical protein